MTSREHNRYEYYKGHYYATKLQVNNENEHDTNNATNQQYETPQYEDNGTNQQYETPQYEEIEEMVHLPIPTEMVHLPVPTETEDKKKYTVIEMDSTEHHTDDTDDLFWNTLTDHTDDTDDTDETKTVVEV